MTNEELIEKIFYFSLKHEEIDMSFFNTRIDMLDEYPSIVFHPMQLYGVRDVFYISYYPEIEVKQNEKYNILNVVYDNINSIIHDMFSSKKYQTKTLKINYKPNFNKITRLVCENNSSLYIVSENHGLSPLRWVYPCFIFLDENDAIKYKNSLTKR